MGADGTDIRLRAPEGRRLHREFPDELGAEGLAGLPVPLVSTFGVHGTLTFGRPVAAEPLGRGL